jgi:small subunit ribosomal protein S21
VFRYAAPLFFCGLLEERRGMKIVVSDNQVDKALRVLKKKLIKEGLLKEMKKREYYEKPSVKRKRKQKESRKRLRKLLTRKTP